MSTQEVILTGTDGNGVKRHRALDFFIVDRPLLP